MDDTQFLAQDYQIKVTYLTNHMQRMWTRFNFFVTVESGLVAGLVFTKDSGSFSDAALYFLAAQAVLSLIWWVFGAQDRRLVAIYRVQISAVWDLLRDRGLGKDLDYAGYTERRTFDFKTPWEWRLEPISITRLPALVPFLLLLFWLAMIGAFLATR